MKDFSVENGKLVLQKEEDSGRSRSAPEEIKRPRRVALNKSKILVNGESGDLYDFSFANCCNPVPGDEIFGYTTSTQRWKFQDQLSQCHTFAGQLRIQGIKSGMGWQ